MWLHLPKKIKKGTSQYYEYSLIKKGCLSGSTLKIIAIIAMAIDHFAASIILYGILMQEHPAFLGHPISMAIPWWNIYQVMRFIGRIGFPIFCFLLIEGFFHTSSKRNMPSGYFSLLCCRNFLSITLYSIHLSISVIRTSFLLCFSDF